MTDTKKKVAWHNVRGADWDEMAEAEKETAKLYGDIIDLSAPVSKKHPKMSLQDRAAQFSPFAALTGFDAAIREEARLTETKPELDEDEKIRLDQAMQMLVAKGGTASATITYFVPDERKEGGAVATVRSEVRRIDQVRRVIILEDADRTEIPLDDILEMEVVE